MAYYPDTHTMDVEIDGHPSIRAVSHVERPGLDCCGTARMTFPFYQPELLPGEEVCWTIGSDIPRIVRIR